jgi:four helix bundle protein
MAAVQRFEELIAWQKARALTAAIYAMTRQGSLSRDWGLVGQMQRAAVSIITQHSALSTFL